MSFIVMTATSDAFVVARSSGARRVGLSLAVMAALLLGTVAESRAVPVASITMTHSERASDLSLAATHGPLLQADLSVVSIDPTGGDGYGRVIFRLTNTSSPAFHNIIRRFTFDADRNFGDHGAILSGFAGFGGASHGWRQRNNGVWNGRYGANEFDFGFKARGRSGALRAGDSIDLIFNLASGTGLNSGSNVFDWLALYDDPGTPGNEGDGTVGVVTEQNRRRVLEGRGRFWASGFIHGAVRSANPSPPTESIPEPSSLALLLAGFAGLAALRIRKKTGA